VAATSSIIAKPPTNHETLISRRGKMPAMPTLLRGFAFGAWLLLVPMTAAAQPDTGAAGQDGVRRLTFGGEVSAVAGPADDRSYFNYTDYQRNALRMSRLRLFGEWHVVDRVSLVGEVRTENFTSVTAPALYVRWQPVASVPLHIQAGRVPPLVGAFGRRAYGRDNAVIGLPLAYQYLTSLRADALPATIGDVIRMRGRGWLSTYPVGTYSSGPGVPLVSASTWDTGVQGTWGADRVEVSAAVTRGAPATPVVRETNDGLMWSGRTSVRLPGGVVLGASAARGQWIHADVLELTPRGTASASSQAIVGADVEVGQNTWLLRAEWLRTTFSLPLASTAPEGIGLSAWAGFVEARFRPHPRWQLGSRFERLDFSTVRSNGAATTWDAPVTRVEGALTYRITRTIEVRAGWQHNWRDGGRVRRRGFPALAALYRF